MEPVVYTPVSAAANLRRSMIVSAVLGIAAVVGAAFAGHVLFGVFCCAGLALGAVNNRMLQKSVIRFATSGNPSKKRFRRGVLARLGAVTLVAIGVAVLVRPEGLGVFVGLAVFQVLMLVGAAVPVMRSLRPTT
ncbi:MAG TPA: ATP synthase subunit I [Jatrophihabitans sp.]|nr:ATP synthase subunit I [Jatrophihabitans sp.]